MIWLLIVLYTTGPWSPVQSIHHRIIRAYDTLDECSREKDQMRDHSRKFDMTLLPPGGQLMDFTCVRPSNLRASEEWNG